MRGGWFVAAAALVWGLWPLFLTHSGMTGRQSGLIAFAVMSLPAPFVLSRAAWANRPARWALAAVGVLDAGNVLFYFTALHRGPVVVAVVTHYLAPLFVALAAPWILKEPRSRRAIVASPVILLGLTLVVGLETRAGAWVTAAAGAASAVCYAGLVLAAKRASVAWSPVAITAVRSPLSAAVVLVVAGSAALPERLDAGFAVMIAGAAVCGLGGALLFNRGLRTVPAHLAGVLTYLEPVFAALLGVLFLNQSLGLAAAVGAALMLGAGAWVAAEPKAGAP